MNTYRPDPRPSAVVWDHFEEAFHGTDFPNVSWALGSDWGMGSPVMTRAQYYDRAVAHMVKIYGPKPSAMRINPINLVRPKRLPR